MIGPGIDPTAPLGHFIGGAWVDPVAGRTFPIPFGGVSGKRSGAGRLSGRHTIMAMSDLHTMCLNIRS